MASLFVSSYRTWSNASFQFGRECMTLALGRFVRRQGAGVTRPVDLLALFLMNREQILDDIFVCLDLQTCPMPFGQLLQTCLLHLGQLCLRLDETRQFLLPLVGCTFFPSSGHCLPSEFCRPTAHRSVWQGRYSSRRTADAPGGKKGIADWIKDEKGVFCQSKPARAWQSGESGSRNSRFRVFSLRPSAIVPARMPRPPRSRDKWQHRGGS